MIVAKETSWVNSWRISSQRDDQSPWGKNPLQKLSLQNYNCRIPAFESKSFFILAIAIKRRQIAADLKEFSQTGEHSGADKV